ncbi:MAG: hypothetical protein JWQ00_2492, partial [Noviherbaspirillum sp.]|nr:hypothetical protein [Noviherbaspirillum sp.]
MTVVAKPLALVLCLVWCIVAAPVRSQEVYLPPFLSAPSSVSGGTGAQQCSSSAGPVIPCGAESMASSGGTVVPVGVANPINVMSGNKYQREDDLPALPGVFGLEIVRHYNSFHSGPGSPNGILGRGWRLSYETSLHVSGRTLQIAQADGSRIIFSRDPFNPSLCATADPADGTVEIRKTARGDEYVWTWNNGRRLDFNSDGKLVQILAPTGEYVTLQYNRRGWLQKVTDPQGRSLHLRYAEKTTAPAQRFTGVVAIDSPVGQYKYEHGSVLPHAAVLDKVHVIANLVKVSYPSGQEAATARTYHYEDPRHPTVLTGISMTGTGNDGQSISRRVSTYAYHANGLAILSVKGAPAQYEKDKDGNIVQPARLVEGTGIEQVTLDFSEPGQTTITNSLGRTTVYRYAMIGGGLRLLEVAGAGCSSCGEPNVRYRYDRLGRLIETIKLDAEGKPVGGMQRELDHFGRIVQVTGTGYRNGKPGKARWLVRYQYQGNQLQPALLARPSVVAGRQHQTRITYNDVGQPTRIMESGWAPAIDGAGAPTPIERVTTLAYASINGRSLLVRVDGPLPNGPADSPADSDSTHIDWDGKGNAVTAITAPGGFKSMAAYDQAGRIIEAVNADGRKSIFTYSARNRLTAVTTDGITQRVGYDAFGNTVEAGHVVAGVYKALARSGFDEAGRSMWAASHLGILRRHRFDSEGKLLELTTQSAGISQAQRLEYDGADRLIAVTDMHGATRRIRWGRDGLPEAMVDALGRETRYRYDATGGVERVTEAANTLHAHLHNTTTRIEYDPFGRTEAVIAPNGAVTRYVRDDFGRMLAVSSADSGTLRKEYDAADRLVVGTDANGNQVRYQYDAAGRIVKQTVIEAQAADTPRKTTATSWRYEGSRLAAIEHPDQAEHYRYDDKGRLVTRMVTFRLAGDSRGTSFTHYRYDEMGQLASASLPDGSVMHYRRNGQNQVTAIERSVLRTPWLRWLRPTQTIVRDLRRDTVGLKNFTYGNGIEAHFQRSREGALARIMYRHPDGRTENEQRSAALDMLFGISTAHAASPDAPANAARPRALDLPTETRALLDHRYLWDAEGNLLHAHNKDSVDDYAYDPQDRLIVAATTPAGQLNAAATGLARYARYFYDGAGNRVLSQEAVTDQADITAGTESSAYGASNSRLLGTSASAPPTQTRYDAGGQPHRFGERKYRWDAFGKLLEVRQANRVLANYRYNHRGERIAKMVNNVRTHFLYE